MTDGDGETRSETDGDPIEVTGDNFGDLLITSLEEALEVARGSMEPARRVVRRRPDTGSEIGQ